VNVSFLTALVDPLVTGVEKPAVKRSPGPTAFVATVDNFAAQQVSERSGRRAPGNRIQRGSNG